MTRAGGTRTADAAADLCYVAAMVVVLAVYAAVVFAFVSRNVSEALDQRLRATSSGLPPWWNRRRKAESPGRGHHSTRSPGCRCGALMAALLYQNGEAAPASVPEQASRSAPTRASPATPIRRADRVLTRRGRLAAARSSSRSAGPRRRCDRSSTSCC